jgi:mannose-1-phosphate guanylyltransferase/phosphomannomutase
MAYEQVRCPYESKGKVMREVGQENRNGQKVELLDGIKIFYDSSWVLILPDSVEPLFHVYAEAPEKFASEELAHEYARKIEHYSTVH